MRGLPAERGPSAVPHVWRMKGLRRASGNPIARLRAETSSVPTMPLPGEGAALASQGIQSRCSVALRP
eukprot:15201481-Alexandrium_andersonii.AAC.1